MLGRCFIWNNSGEPQKYYIICVPPAVNPGALDPDDKPHVLSTILAASGETADSKTVHFSPGPFHAVCGTQLADDHAPFAGMKSVAIVIQDPATKTPGSITVVTLTHDGIPSIATEPDEPPPVPPTSHEYCTWDGMQPFFPVFCEWEAVYYHVPFAHWEMQHGASPVARDMACVRYEINSAANISGISDTRALAGRNILLPQTGEALANDFRRLLDRIAGAEEGEAGPAGWPAVMKDLPILSALMKGLRAHLTTRVAEMHMKPSVHIPGRFSSVLEIAAAAAADVGFTVDSLSLIGAQTGLTPYGDSIAVDPEHCPFKPVTHGQMVVTKLNIVDRFGQVLSALPDDGGPKLADGKLEWLYPCVGEELKPSTTQVGDVTVPLTVLPQPAREKCGIVQLPPGLNQAARLNGCFVVPDGRAGAAPWKPANEWDDPVWGWAVINYADYGLQMFYADGTFCCEIRLGGPSGVSQGFPLKNKHTPDDKSHQLEALITMLNTGASLEAFCHVINRALASTSHAPASYAGFLQGLVGRPLALANMGCSLELAEPPLVNQATSGRPELAEDSILEYEFAVKLGDGEKRYNGLAGYFACGDNGLNFSELFTFFPLGGDTAAAMQTTGISPATYPRIKPYYPLAVSSPQLSIAQMAAQHNSQLHIFGALMDPFSSVLVSTGILPTAAIQLSPWAVEAAMRTITAFFRLGPVLVTTDLPPPTTFLPQLPTAAEFRSSETSKLTLPAITTVSKWAWLQPYLPTGEQQQFVAAGLRNAPSTAPLWENTPYTALEGYLWAVAQSEDPQVKSAK